MFVDRMNHKIVESTKRALVVKADCVILFKTMPTPSRKHKNTFPPLPLPCKNSSRSSTRGDSTTVGTTASPSESLSCTEFSFQTPSTKTCSPGRYTWSISSKKSQIDNKTPRNFIIDGLPPSPARRNESPSPRRYASRISKGHNTPSPSRAPIKCKRQPRSASPTLRYDHIRLQRNESILDLTDSEDEDDPVVVDSSLRQLIRVTSLTLSREGKMMEEESYIELEPNDSDQEDDGLKTELRQLKNSEERCHNEITFAIDKVAYGHESTADWNEKFVSNQGKMVHMQALDDAKKEEGIPEGFIDKIIGMCICCGDNPGQVKK